MVNTGKKSIRKSQAEIESAITQIVGVLDKLEKDLHNLHQLTSYATKRVEIMFGIAFYKKLFEEKDIDEGYRIWKEFMSVMNYCSMTNQPLKARIEKLLEWNHQYGSFFYISPAYTGIAKELADYEGPDKDALVEMVKEYVNLEEDNQPIKKVETDVPPPVNPS